MVVVWDVSHAIRGGEVSIVAKAHTDVDIQRMRIAEFDDSRYCHIKNINLKLFLFLNTIAIENLRLSCV